MSIFSCGTGGAFVYGTQHVVYMRNPVRLNWKSRYVKKFEETFTDNSHLNKVYLAVAPAVRLFTVRST